jgi:MarR family transcriptional regulator, organic hydroperoxide resistance regulator
MSNIRALARAAEPAVDGGLVPLERSVGYHVRQLAETWQAVMDARAEAHGITVIQWRYLRELWEKDGLSMGELTRRVARQGPTTVAAVQLLEKAGLVTVAKSDEDRRKTFISLTRRGHRLAATMSPVIREVNELAMEDLTEAEVRAFKRVVVRIQRRLDREGGERNGWSARRTQRLAEEVGL